MLFIFGILISIFLSIVLGLRFNSWRIGGTGLSVLSRSTTTSKTPFQKQVSDTNNNNGVDVYANHDYPAIVKTKTDSGTFEPATLEKKHVELL